MTDVEEYRKRGFPVANRKVFAAAPAKAQRLERNTRAAFYRYLLLRRMESENTPGKVAGGAAVWGDCGVERPEGVPESDVARPEPTRHFSKASGAGWRTSPRG